MAKYIPDSYLYRAIGADIEGRCGRCTQSRSDCMCHSLSRMDICGILEDAATSDVVEVRHGRWTGHYIGNGRFSIDEDTCSLCGSRFYQIAETGCDWNFCPNCGAKMEGNDG